MLESEPNSARAMWQNRYSNSSSGQVDSPRQNTLYLASTDVGPRVATHFTSKCNGNRNAESGACH